MGILYFVQPQELISTNRYKIGRSSKNDLSRLRSYHKGARNLAVFDCLNENIVESILIQEFKKKYKIISGNEYFEIKDENEALKLFIEIFLKYRKDVEIKQEEKSYIEEVVDIVDNITTKFSNLKISWGERFSYKQK